MKSGVLLLPKPKRAVGRPSTYRSELCAEIIAAMGEGLSAEAAAAKIGISARSLFNWQRLHPEFLQAIQEGRHLALLWWEQRALAMANGQPGNAQLIMLGLKNRSRAASGWHHDSQRFEHSGPDGAAVSIENWSRIDVALLSADQRAALRTLLLEARENASE